MFLDETTGEWRQENIWTERPARSRACSVAIDDRRIAYIGGQHPRNFGGGGSLPEDERMRRFGQRISVYNHDAPAPKETPNFARLANTRTHLSCTLIPNCNGKPTVAICK